MASTTAPQTSSTMKKPRPIASEMASETDEVAPSDILANKVIDICQLACERKYVRDFITGVTDGGRRSPWNRLFEGIWAVAFARTVGRTVKIDKSLLEQTPDTVLTADRNAARIRSMCAVAAAIYAKGYNKFEALNTNPETLIAKDKKAWADLLEAFFNLMVHCKGDDPVDFSKSQSAIGAGSRGLTLHHVDIPALGMYATGSPDKTKMSKQPLLSTPAIADGACKPTYAEVIKGTSPPTRNMANGFATPAKGTSSSTAIPASEDRGEGMLSQLKSGLMSAFKTKPGYSKEEMDSLIADRCKWEYQAKALGVDMKEMRESKSRAEKEVAMLTAHREALEAKLKEYATTSEMLTNAQTELLDMTNRFHESQQRLQETIASVNDLRNGLDANTQEARERERRLQTQIELLSAEVVSLKAQVESKEQQLMSNTSAYEDKLQGEIERGDALERDLDSTKKLMQHEIADLREQIDSKSAELNSSNETIAALNADIACAMKEIAELQSKMAAAENKMRCAEVKMGEEKQAMKVHEQQVHMQLKVAGKSLSSFRNDMSALRTIVSDALSQTTASFTEQSQQLVRMVEAARLAAKDANERYIKEQAERRKLHNQLQEARGNIRVFCRIRPMLSKEFEAGEAPVVKVATPFEVQVLESSSERNGGRMTELKTFEFDRCFSAESSQSDVFDEVQPMVTSALDGFHACIFAYGQTGSGKTFTMEGIPSNRGVYFRALASLFEQIQHRRAEYNYTLKVSMVEIYNENVKDLLGSPVASEEDAGGLEVKTGPNGNYLPDATIVEVGSIDQVEELMGRGATNRSVGRTNANEHSSRSHSLLMIDIYGTNMISDTKSYGRLVLVDLAGSERVSKSGAEGQRLKEAQNINKSLSALGDVIAALSNKASHIPFRNSKLTWLLADSLGKDNKTLMIVQVSPITSSRQETTCSLTFASRVRKVELGKAVKHADSNELSKVKSELKRLQDIQRAASTDVEKFREQLAVAQESEAAARSRSAELEKQLGDLQRESSASHELAKKVEQLQQSLRTEREILKLEKETIAEKNDEIEKLNKALKEASKTAKSAAKSADEGSAAKTEAAIKKALDDERSKLKVESRKAVADAEASLKFTYEKQVEAVKKQMKESLAAADAKAKADVAAAVALAKLQWEKDSKRAAMRKERMSFASKRNARLSVAASVAEEAESENLSVAATATSMPVPAQTSDMSDAVPALDDGNASTADTSLLSQDAVGEPSLLSIDPSLMLSGVTVNSLGDSLAVHLDSSYADKEAESFDVAAELGMNDSSFVSVGETCVETDDAVGGASAAFASPIAGSGAETAFTPLDSNSGKRQATPFKQSMEQIDDEEATEEVELFNATDGEFENDSDAEGTCNKLYYAAPTPKKGRNALNTPARRAFEAGASKVAETTTDENNARDENRRRLEDRRMKRELGFASPPVQGILKRKMDADAKSGKGIRLLSPTTSAVVLPGVTPGKKAPIAAAVPAAVEASTPMPPAKIAGVRSLSRGSTVSAAGSAASDAESVKTTLSRGSTKSAPAKSTNIGGKATTKPTTAAQSGTVPPTAVISVDEDVVAEAVLKPIASASNMMTALANSSKISKAPRTTSKFVAAALGTAARVKSAKMDTTTAKPAVRVSVMDASSSAAFERRAAMSKKATR